MMTGQITLASASPSRLAILTSAGINTDAVPANVDETSAKVQMRREKVAIRDQAMRLAELKAQKVSLSRPGLVLGADQMLNLDEEAFDKPISLERAAKQLEKMSDKTHVLETAAVIYEDGAPVWRFLARPKLTMRRLTPDYIDAYLEAVGTDALKTVGGYQLEGLGGQLFSHVEGDYFSILGLPLFPVLDYLRTRGMLKA